MKGDRGLGIPYSSSYSQDLRATFQTDKQWGYPNPGGGGSPRGCDIGTRYHGKDSSLQM